MKYKSSILATMLVTVATLSITSQAATEPSLITNAVGGAIPAATFTGGATSNEGVNFLSAVPAGQPAGIWSSFKPASADVGKEGDLYMVVNAGGVWYMRTATGFSAWNGTIPGLVKYSTKTLAASEAVRVTDLETLAAKSFDGNKVAVYIGYMTSTSPLVYSSPMEFTMDNTPASSCPVGSPGGLVPITPRGKVICVLKGTYKTNVRLTSNYEYLLSGAVFIGGDNKDSASITMDAGVKVYGESGADVLVISRGSKIHVNGTKAAPVIMTAAIDSIATRDTVGQWGGLVINGNAPINTCVIGTAQAFCTAEGEASTGLYGGSNAADNSGNLNYLQVKYAGYLITPVNELNGIALQGVGNGTLIDYVQVHNNADDGIEFFGGTVDAKHLYLTGNEDDSLDWTYGWTGKVQHVVIMHNDRTGTHVADKGMEADNNDLGFDNLPRSKPTISNVTMIGSATSGGAMNIRRGTGAILRNFVIAGFEKACLKMDDIATYTNAGTSVASLTGNLTMTSSVMNCTKLYTEFAGAPWTSQSWFEAQTGNSTAAVGMTTYINNAAVNARTATTITDSFFDVTSYIGAVKDVAGDWSAGWTFKN